MRLAVTLAVVAFIPLASFVLQTFDCVETPMGRRLAADMTIDCSSSTHIVAKYVSALVLVLLTLVLAGVTGWLFYLKGNNALLDSAGGRFLAGLYEPYKLEFPFMEAVKLGVRGWVVMAAFFTNSGWINSLFVLVGVLPYALIVSKYQPWHNTTLDLWCTQVNDALNKFDTSAAIAAVIVVVAGIVFELTGRGDVASVLLTVIGIGANVLGVLYAMAWAQAWARRTGGISGPSLPVGGTVEEWAALGTEAIRQHRYVGVGCWLGGCVYPTSG